MFITLLNRGDSGKQRILVGDPEMASDILGMPTSLYARQSIFDDIARKLEANDFEVIRNPLPLTYQDDPSRKKRYWYFATSNNALVQTSQNDEQVWIPTYGHGTWPELVATDDANALILSNLGYTVNRLGDFHPFAFNLGVSEQ
jgi:hypothetical protein